jgi:hypothetical protein
MVRVVGTIFYLARKVYQCEVNVPSIGEQFNILWPMLHHERNWELCCMSSVGSSFSVVTTGTSLTCVHRLFPNVVIMQLKVVYVIHLVSHCLQIFIKTYILYINVVIPFILPMYILSHVCAWLSIRFWIGDWVYWPLKTWDSWLHLIILSSLISALYRPLQCMLSLFSLLYLHQSFPGNDF